MSMQRCWVVFNTSHPRFLCSAAVGKFCDLKKSRMLWFRGAHLRILSVPIENNCTLRSYEAVNCGDARNKCQVNIEIYCAPWSVAVNAASWVGKEGCYGDICERKVNRESN